MTQIAEQLAKSFKRNYAYKMGGSQTLVFPNGQEFTFNDKEYYSGRGAKYNSSIKHDVIGIVIISKKELSAKIKIEKERTKRIKENQKIEKESIARYAENLVNGIYGLKEYEYGILVELSNDEKNNQFFDEKRLAKTLDITIQDASLLNSNGKTYVFAKQISTGKTIELYHASLICNQLNIYISYPTPERIAEFQHEEWNSAPFASAVGMTENKNHFVC